MDQIQDNLGKGAGLTLSIPILDGFRRRINVSRAKLELRNAEIDLENTENNLQQQTAQVLINLQTAKEKYLEIREQVEAYKESFRVAEVRFEAGDINSVEFLLQKTKYDQANISLVVAQYEWQLRQRIANYYNGQR
jgi:outer membrane protein